MSKRVRGLPTPHFHSSSLQHFSPIPIAPPSKPLYPLSSSSYRDKCPSTSIFRSSSFFVALSRSPSVLALPPPRVLCVGKGEYTVCFLCPRIERRTLVFFFLSFPFFFWGGGGRSGFCGGGRDTGDTERGPSCKPYHARQRDRGERGGIGKGEKDPRESCQFPGFFCAVLLDFLLDKSRLWEKFGSFSFPSPFCTVRYRGSCHRRLLFPDYPSKLSRLTVLGTYCILLFHTVP